MVFNLLTDKEPTITFNGSTIKFGLSGDIEIYPQRHLIGDAKLAFISTPAEQRKRTIAAFALGSDAFNRFNKLEHLKGLFEEVERRLGALPEYTRNKAVERLSPARLKFINMGQQYALIQYEGEEKVKAAKEFDLICTGIESLLVNFLRNPFLFDERTDEQKIEDMIRLAHPGVEVVRVERVEEDKVDEGFEDQTIELDPPFTDVERLQALVNQGEQEANGQLTSVAGG